VIGDTAVVTQTPWQWDPTLFAGSAAYYVRGRVAYPAALADGLAAELGLDGSGRLLDIGCGPGSLTLRLADRFTASIGVDADPGMLGEADRLAAEAGVGNVRWLHLRAEDLPAGLGRFRVISFAQSFHWMDRALVAATTHGMLDDGGACVHVHAETHQGVETDADLPYPAAPRSGVADLVRRYLGPVRRAGRGYLPNGTGGGEEDFYRAAGFTGPQRLTVPGRVITRTAEEVVAAVFSLSSSTPHLLGDRRAAFETDLRDLLALNSPTGLFSEQMREIAVDIWRP